MPPPLALDIDGTITRPEGGVDERVFAPLRAWSGPVVFTTGKAFPYPIALCQFLAMPERAIAENGGVIAIDGVVERAELAERVETLAEGLADAGIDLGWSTADLVNRWRETELAVERSVDRDELAAVADRFGFEVVDSGYAYHVKDPAVTKGRALERACALLGVEFEDVLAIGDSENDVATFERAGHAVAVANADEAAREAADEVLDVGYAAGTLAVLERFG
ncbi:MAG: phosphoglycolate phosphatase [Halobacteriales archaeon]